MKVRHIEVAVICAVALHSFVLGTIMLVNPTGALRFAGWEYEGPRFFPAQSGIFLLILGGAYLAGAWKRPFAWFLVASKAAAVIFLVGEALLGGAPRICLLAALGDAAMGAAVAIVAAAATRGERLTG